MKEINTNVKIGKWLSSDILFQIQHYINDNNLPKQISDMITFLVSLPENSNQDNKIVFTEDTLINLLNKKSRRFKYSFAYNKKKIKDPLKVFFKMFASDQYDTPLFQKIESNRYDINNNRLEKIESDMYKLNNLSEFMSKRVNHKGLFKFRMTDRVIKTFDEDITEVRKSTFFFCMVLMQNLYNETVFDHEIVKTIFGLSKSDVKRMCKKFGLKISPVHRELSEYEVKELSLPPAQYTFDSDLNTYYVPIGYNITSKTSGNDITKEMKEIQSALGNKIQVNPKVLKEIKNRIINRDYNFRVGKNSNVVSFGEEHDNNDLYINSSKVKTRFYSRNYLSKQMIDYYANFIMTYNTRLSKTITIKRKEFQQELKKHLKAQVSLYGEVVDDVTSIYKYNIRQASVMNFV